ncbi:MAG: energy-coupled thiamine transporter ThiT [Nitrososphaerota archaeon]|nr:energy-coupled thiamine transporter ThiT [Nitrososphaerota archaeon]
MSSINRNEHKSPKILAEVAIFIALATALSMIPGWHLPQGGSVTYASMVPLLWLALRRGPKVGIFAGVVYGFVQLAILSQVYYPTQVLLDYPLAFGCIGLAGFFKNHTITGAIVAIIGRFTRHLISGAIFFASYAPSGMNPWVYSCIYNGSFMVFELLISCAVLALLQKNRVLKTYM